MTSPAYVNSKTAHGITTIEFFHPASNSLPGNILAQLAEAITAAGKDTATAVIILRSGGEKAFCAGASFDELVAINDTASGQVFFNGFAHVINAMRTCGKIVIARVQGKAVGGGVGLISAADYAIAISSAAVKLSELAVGIGPFVVGPAVERKVGSAAFSQLAIDATEWRSAAWAQQHGMYAAIYDHIEDVDAEVERLATRLAESSPEAMLELKNIFWEDTQHWGRLLTERAAISGRLVLSDFTRNAIAAFKTKK